MIKNHRKFLQMIRKGHRGRLKIYLGYATGVGKTSSLLWEGQRLRHEGMDVVVGFISTRGDAGVEKLMEGLEIVPSQSREYSGITLDEMDLDAVLRRHPQVVLVDDLHHENVPGSTNATRLQDVQDLQRAGIHVISATSIEHVESIAAAAETITGKAARSTIPDEVLMEADQVVNIDVPADELLKRYERMQVAQAGISGSRVIVPVQDKLEQLRAKTLRLMALLLEKKRSDVTPEETLAPEDNIMACVSATGRCDEALLRHTARMAGRLNRAWYAFHVETPDEEKSPEMRERVQCCLNQAEKMGARVVTFRGKRLDDAIIEYAREHRIGYIVLGRSKQPSKVRHLFGGRTLMEKLVQRAEGFSVVIVNTTPENEKQPVIEPVPVRIPKELAVKTQLSRMVRGREERKV